MRGRYSWVWAWAFGLALLFSSCGAPEEDVDWSHESRPDATEEVTADAIETEAPICGGLLRIRCPWGMVCVLAGGDSCNRIDGNDCLGHCMEMPGGW